MAVCTNLDTKGKLLYHMWIQFAAVFLSWTIQGVFCAENATKGACGSCDRPDLRAKHKLYNWLVLSIVLLLLALLLILVGFICYRMWPRDHSAFDRAVFRYNLEHEQRVLTEMSSSRTSRGEQDSCCRGQQAGNSACVIINGEWFQTARQVYWYSSRKNGNR